MRRRKRAANRIFRYAKQIKAITDELADGIDTPKGEERRRNWLTTTEYYELLAAAGGNLQRSCLLTVKLQAGARISEPGALTLGDVDLTKRLLQVRADKGMRARRIPLEKKASATLTGRLKIQPATARHSSFAAMTSRSTR